MALNLLKLCVGAESLEDQIEWCERRLAGMRAAGEKEQLFHVTRMVPKRSEELLDDGSLYWVIKGNIQLRQKLDGIEVFTDSEGIRRCKLLLNSNLVATEWQPRRAFQGWRYLETSSAPPDLGRAAAQVPPQLKRELAELGLL